MIFRLLFVVLLVSGAGVLFGQTGWEPPPRFLFEVDVKSGEFTEKLNTAPLTVNYPNVVNAVEKKITFSESNSFSYNFELGYYFNAERTLAVVTGLMYITEKGNIGTDTFHVEFQSTDYKGNVFRQLISSDGPLNESVKSSNLSIPINLRYKKKVNDDIFVSVDGGVVFNLMMQNKYSTTSGFDYEAIYKFEGNGSSPTTVYDAAPVPGPTDWLITRTQFQKTNPEGDVMQYFNFLHGIGYNVALNDSLTKSGKVSYKSQSIGFNLQPAVNYKLRDKIYGKAGLYVLYQSFSNTTPSGSAQFAQKIGDYNSLLNYTKTVQNFSYGVMFGLNFYF